MNAYLELDRVEVSYGAVQALHPLTLSVQAGEFFCLLGPSGCGKTTTLGIVAGFTRAGGGRVLLGGQDVTMMPPQQRQMGVVFQNYALFPHMTAAQNVGYGLKLRKREAADIERRVNELLALVRLEGKGDRYPRQMSGGEQQRVAIARALAIEPRLLLLDEPLSNLDARLREEMRNELKRIQRTTGVTTIFVTHDQEEAFGAADRIAILNHGRLEQVGTPTEIYQSPRSMFVANFIGRSNALNGTLSAPGVFEVQGQRFACGRPAADSSRSWVLFLRPEELKITRNPASPNSVRGTVVEIVYVGAIVNMRVQTDIGELLAYRLGTGGEPVAAGDAVQVGWEPGAGSLLAADAHG